MLASSPASIVNHPSSAVAQSKKAIQAQFIAL
jgi:hypothetical protein